ncbi:MAG: hypothetical protein E7647_03340 [Ruminococcaceae bacterium]|nr:hypothetical protein [Oscillospiraceae bacterium]
MKKRLRTIGIGLAVGLAFANLSFTALSLFMKDLWSINFLYEFNIMVAVMTISGGLIFKEGVSPLEKWVRRGVVIIIWCIVDPLCLWFFGHFDHSCGHTDYEKLLKTILITTPVVIVIFIVCYMIGDRIEKKHIARINIKLSENSFFESFKNNAHIEETTEAFSIYSFEYESIKYTVLKVMKKANDRTVIRLGEEKVVWEQLYPLFNRPAKEEWVVTRKSFAKKGTVGVIVFNGTPSRILGLDENGYVSASRKVKHDGEIYVLTSAELQFFEP